MPISRAGAEVAQPRSLIRREGTVVQRCARAVCRSPSSSLIQLSVACHHGSPSRGLLRLPQHPLASSVATIEK